MLVLESLLPVVIRFRIWFSLYPHHPNLSIKQQQLTIVTVRDILDNY